MMLWQPVLAPPQKRTAIVGNRPWGIGSLAVAFFVLDVVKHLGLLSAGPTQPWSDSETYWRLGQDAARGDLWLWESATASRTVAYPWFLAFCQTLGATQALWLAVILQHGLELATSLLTAATVWEVTRSLRAATITYGLCLPLTARCLFANSILTESWATFLLTLLMWLFSRCFSTRRTSSLLLAALVLGISILVRPSAVAFVPAFLFVAWTSCPEPARQFRRTLRCAAACGLCAAVVMPWCLRNQLLWNRFSITVFVGRELWTATFSPWTGANLSLPPTEAGLRVVSLTKSSDINIRHNGSVHAALMRSGLTEVEADDLMRIVAWEAIQRQPARAASHVGARCLSFWYVKDWELPEADWPAQDLWQNQLPWSSPQQAAALRRGLRSTPERNFQAMWLWSAATWLGVGGMLVYQPYRSFGLTLAGLLLGLTLLTAMLEIPLYRYRCVLEPVMQAAIVIGAMGWMSRARPAP